MSLSVRDASPTRDAAACAAIYAPYVRDTGITFETDVPDAAEFERRIARALERHAWLVLGDHDDGAVTGFAYASEHRARAAYRWAVDVAIYLDPAHTGRGGGRALYLELLSRIRTLGYRIACAGIALPNDASLALHRAMGFTEVGVYRDIGYKLGQWRSVAWWQLALPGDDPPAEPLSRPGGQPSGAARQAP